MSEPILVIMAAGMGSRYGGLKQIDPVGSGGEIIMDFSLYDAFMAGFKKAIFIIKREFEMEFKEIIEKRAGRFMEVEYAFQELTDLPYGYTIPEGREKPWGTCHAVLSARNIIDGPFAVINADDYYGAGAFHSMYDFLVQAKDDNKLRYAMVGYMLENTLTENGHVARGVCEVSEAGYLKEINERTKIMWRDYKDCVSGEESLQTEKSKDTEKVIAFTEDEGKTWTAVPKGTPVSMNFWGFNKSMIGEMQENFPKFLDRIFMENPLKGEYFLPLAVDKLIKEDRATIKVLYSHDKWYGVTYKEDKQDVVNALQSMKDKGLYPEKLWK